VKNAATKNKYWVCHLSPDAVRNIDSPAAYLLPPSIGCPALQGRMDERRSMQRRETRADGTSPVGRVTMAGLPLGVVLYPGGVLGSSRAAHKTGEMERPGSMRCITASQQLMVAYMYLSAGVRPASSTSQWPGTVRGLATQLHQFTG
jgi:hypothetical protein